MEWLLWIDLETSGLDVNNCYILQIASILTDFNVHELFKLPEMTIKINSEKLDNMDPWCKEQHTQSGLIKKVKESKISLLDVENEIINFLNSKTSDQDIIYIAGNSVHFDKKFIDFHLPKLSKKLSYRIIDVSSIALVCKNLNPRVYDKRPVKTYLHTAESDLLESINEYNFYKQYFFN